MSTSVIGSEAISEMRNVVTISEISSSPSWRFPISRITSIREVYIINVRISTVSISHPAFLYSICKKALKNAKKRGENRCFLQNAKKAKKLEKRY